MKWKIGFLITAMLMIGGTAKAQLLIKGNVFGGGENAVVTHDVTVNFNGRVVNNVLQDTIKGDLYGGGGFADVNTQIDSTNSYAATTRVTLNGGVVKGNVYGGGLGRLADPANSITEAKAEVKGPIYVTISDGTTTNVFGCNNINGSPEELVQVNIQGGNVQNVYGGGNTAAYTPTYDTLLSPQVNILHGTVTGNVYGSGLGQTAAVTANPVVTVGDDVTAHNPSVNGNVYGGGQQAAVNGNTYVNVVKGTLGTDTKPNTDPEIDGLVFGGSEGLPGLENHAVGMVRDTAFVTIGVQNGNNADIALKGSVFGGGDDGQVRETRVVVHSGTIGKALTTAQMVDNLSNPVIIYRGNVYGGGRGIDKYEDPSHVMQYDSEEGRVHGNTSVTINGGKIYHDVYGAGSLASVGTLTGNTYNTGTGKATVTITGGEIGMSLSDAETAGDRTKAGINSGQVFGSGRGIAGTDFMGFANVDSAVVNISGGQIYGLVFGGGANGHVKGSTVVNMTGGTLGINEATAFGNTTQRWEVHRGNLYGGGRGIDHDGSNHLSNTAGKVYGNTNINISGTAQVYQNVFGGGSIASVGEYSYDAEGNLTGHVSGGTTTVNITGGTIGVDGNFNGRVFGAGRGEAGSAFANYTFVNNTNVTVSGTAQVNGCVFGSGDNGHTYNDTHVNIDGGTVGSAWTKANNGNVFGGGRGQDTDASGDLSRTAGKVSGNTYVKITGGLVKHQVYGGGHLSMVGEFNYDDEGNITSYKSGGNTNVTVLGGEIGNPTIADDNGHVFGAGRGVAGGAYFKYNYVNHSSVIVKDSIDNGTLVSSPVINGSVFGGGENGHVYDSTNVTIDGGTIGTELTWEHQTTPKDTIVTEMTEGTHINRGNVYGGGRGIEPDENHTHSYTAGWVRNKTRVVINGGKIYHNVYGGGSLASVGLRNDTETLGNTYVVINGGEIGMNNTEATHTFTIPGTTRDTTINYSGINSGYVFGGGRGEVASPSSNEYINLAFVDNTEVTVNPNSGHIYGAVFGGGANGHVAQNTKVNIKGGTIGHEVPQGDQDEMALHPHIIYYGNVYGGGRGIDHNDENALSATAGKVYGNTEVNVSGGTIFHCVYGGGSLANVGVEDDEQTGLAKVTVTGGTIGTTGKNNGSVFGGARGEAGITFTGLAYVKNTEVVIGQKNGANSALTITGSVFGGGANGHVRENTDVKMYSGTIGTPLTAAEMVEADPVQGVERRHLFRGNIYGGGRGVDHDASGALSSTAGRVYGNTKITIRGGKVYHNVYGGGSLASVGTYTENASGVLVFTDNTGHADVTIKAGEIGMSRTDAAAVTGATEWQAGLNSGQVYGSGRGETGSTYSHFAFTNTTHVTIDSAAMICGAVFGGGANGHVKDSTFVEIKGGTIGVDDIGEHINLYRGNVYGGGRGIDVDNAHGVSATAGQVYGNTRIEISNGYICHNVFGGGSLASVGTYEGSGDAMTCTSGGNATVKLSGGQVGVNSEKNGRVYGSGRGYPGTSTTGVDFSNMTYVNNTYVVVEGTAKIMGNVFGSGDNGHVINDAHVTMTGGEIGYLNGGFINGNVYGGGRGVDTLVGAQHGQLSLTAGLVKGDTYVNLSGGHVKHNVYGGGYMASVNGDTHIEIGGDVHIGNGADNVHGGMVFGGGRGIERPYEDEGVTHVVSTPAYARIKGNTNVTITGNNVTIDSTVYGGGRLGAVDGFAYVTVDGATLHYNVFGAGEGVAGNDPFKGDVKRGTVVNLLGGSNISGNVYGGGRNGTVGKPWGGSSKDVATVQVNLGSSSSTDNDIVNGSIFGGGMAAQVNGTATVNVYSGTVTESVYGGNQSNDTVKGNIAVNILGGTLGSQTALNSHQTVDVFGGGYGENTRTIGDVTVTVNKAGTVAPVIYGDVYGGSALGTVNSDASTSTDKTTVNILNGNLVSKKETVTRGFNVYYGGNVYAGGLGEKGNTTKGAVNGETTVNIGEARPGTSPYTHLDTTFYVGYATIGGNVYGANNTGGSPQKDHTVNIYGTAHTTTDMADYDPATNGGTPATYAIANVFGGGNFADCNISGKTSYVNIFGCDNTIERVFGGGDASASYNVDTDIQGGRMDQVFGGGNGERGASFAANIDGNVELAIHGGKVNTFFVGSNQNGVISGTQTVTVDSNGPCGESMDIDEFFCGGNFEDVIGDVNATIDCHDGMTVRNLYGGCNNADIKDDPNTPEKEGNVNLTVKGGTFENVYGGSKGDLAAIGEGHTDHPVVIEGNVNLTITGGTIDTVFGACNINGNVLGGVIINVYDSLNTTCPLVIHNIYGGGRTASYEPTTAGAYPEINIMRGTVSQDTINTGTGIVLTGGNVFGGGYGNHWGKEAIVKSNPKITIGDNVAGHSSNVATIRGNVYGGGHGAKVQGDPHIILDGTSIVNVDGNVFGGGSQAEVEGNPKVEIK